MKKTFFLGLLIIVGACSGMTEGVERCDKYCLPSDVKCSPKCYWAPGFQKIGTFLED